MSKSKITELEHKEEGGFDPALTAVTAGIGALTAFTPKTHDVTVRDDRNVVASGKGETHSEARRNAVENLSSDRREKQKK